MLPPPLALCALRCRLPVGILDSQVAVLLLVRLGSPIQTSNAWYRQVGLFLDLLVLVLVLVTCHRPRVKPIVIIISTIVPSIVDQHGCSTDLVAKGLGPPQSGLQFVLPWLSRPPVRLRMVCAPIHSLFIPDPRRRYKQANSIPLASLNVLSYSLWFSRGAGLALSVDVLLLPLPMCRNLLRWIRPKVRWLRLDESQWFHRQVAYSMLAWTVVHVCGHYVNFFNISKHDMRPQTPVEMHYTEVAGITGHIMLLCMLLIYTSAHAKIRQQSFETFWYTHHLFIPFFISIYSHAAGCFVRDTPQPYSPFDHNFCTHCLGYQAWRWELLGGSIYMFERIYREIRAARETHITKVVRHPSGRFSWSKLVVNRLTYT